MGKYFLQEFFGDDIKRVKIEGLSEDDFNNFLIEMYLAEKNKDFIKSPSPICGETVTITLSKKNYANYLDLKDQNN